MKIPEAVIREAKYLFNKFMKEILTHMNLPMLRVFLKMNNVVM